MCDNIKIEMKWNNNINFNTKAQQPRDLMLWWSAIDNFVTYRAGKSKSNTANY